MEFTKAYINNMYKFYGYGIWLVCLKANNKIIGRAGLSNREVDGVNMLELGYVIGEEYQSKGYAFEACNAVCEFAENTLYKNELVCFIRKENIPSVRLAEKLGFELVDYVQSEDNVYAYYLKKLKKKL